jgi:hypothetical protein
MPSPTTWPTYAAEKCEVTYRAVDWKAAFCPPLSRRSLAHILQVMGRRIDGKDFFCFDIDSSSKPNWVFAKMQKTV